LLKLGLVVSKRSIQRYRRRGPAHPSSQTWRTFLRNHAHHLWAADLLTVQTLTFKTLYVLVFIAHGRRELVHINVTANPTAAWVWRQLIEATPWGQQPRHLLRDHDAVYGRDFRPRARRIGIDAIATPVASARANAIVERVIGTLGSRRGCLGCLPWRFFWRRVHDEHRCRTSPVDKSRIRRRFNSRSGHEHSVRTRCRRRTVCGLGRVAAGRQEHVLPRREVSGGLGPQRRRKSTGPCRPSPGYHTFAAPTDIRIDLYCSTRAWQRSAEAFMSAVDARHMHEQVCPSTGSSPSGNIAPSAATQVANAPLPVTIPIMIEDAPCTGSCEGALTIDCVTWQPGVASQPIVVPASDFSAASQELGCQPWAE
jgi:hypothetical protein